MKKLTHVPSVGAGMDAEMVRFPVAGWVVTFNTYRTQRYLQLVTLCSKFFADACVGLTCCLKTDFKFAQVPSA